MKNILKTTAILLIMAGIFACGKEKDDNTWKLSGIVDVQTGTIKDLEPKDCKECYTLTFDTDTTVSVHNINGIVYHFDLLNLTPKRVDIEYILYTYFWNDKEYRDPEKFRVAIFSIESYTLTSNELKLFYNQKNNYLLFKLIEQ